MMRWMKFPDQTMKQKKFLLFVVGEDVEKFLLIMKIFYIIMKVITGVERVLVMYYVNGQVVVHLVELIDIYR